MNAEYNFNFRPGTDDARRNLAARNAFGGQGFILIPMLMLMLALVAGCSAAFRAEPLTALRPEVSPSNLPSATVNSPYIARITAYRGVTPYHWSVPSGELPTGLMLKASTGEIEGSSTQAGVFTFTAQVTDAENPPKSATQTFTLNVVQAPLQITTSAMSGGIVGSSYSTTLEAVSGITPYSWSLVGDRLPKGLTLQSSTGEISGTPAVAGVFSFTVQVRDSAELTASDSLPIKLFVASDQPVSPTLPTLPQATVDPSMPNTDAYTVVEVNAGGDLQAAINNARCEIVGTIIKLRAGATFSGSFRLPAKACATGQNIIIRSDAADSNLPSFGTRIDPAYGPHLPTIVASLPNRSAFYFDPSSTNYRLMFLNIVASTTNYSATDTALVSVGGALTTAQEQPKNIIVDRCLIRGSDNPPIGVQRGVELACTYCGVVSSYIDQIHLIGIDSQAIAGWNSTGPWLIDNNYLSAAGENILAGGADPTIPNAIPSDVVVTHNWIYKPMSWRVTPWGGTLTATRNNNVITFSSGAVNIYPVCGDFAVVTGMTNASFDGTFTILCNPAPTGSTFSVSNSGPNASSYGGTWSEADPSYAGTHWTVKKLLEMKVGRRWLIEANVFENNWVDAQTGEAILIMAANPGHTPWAQVSDVTCRYNKIVRSMGGIAGFSSTTGNGYPDLGNQSDRFYDNLAVSTGGASGNYFAFGGNLHGLPDILLDHNTIIVTGIPPTTMMGAEGIVPSGVKPFQGFAFHNNIIGYDSRHGVGANCRVNGVAQSCWATDAWWKNIVYDTTSVACDAGSFGPRSVLCPIVNIDAVGFVDPPNGDYRLCSEAGVPDAQCRGASRGHNAATDGTDVGADINTLNLKIAGVKP